MLKSSITQLPVFYASKHLHMFRQQPSTTLLNNHACQAKTRFRRHYRNRYRENVYNRRVNLLCKRASPHVVRPVSCRRLTAMSGRAAPVGLGAGPGTTYWIASCRPDHDALWAGPKTQASGFSTSVCSVMCCVLSLYLDSFIPALQYCKENGPRVLWLSKFWCLMINTICGLTCFLVFMFVVHRMQELLGLRN
jgi:hypothetical protein